MDLHRIHNSKTAVTDSVNHMDVGHNQSSECYRETVHRQTCFRSDTQILGEGLHKIHTNMFESHDVVADGINQMCHGENRDPGYRQTRIPTLPCHNRGNCHHYEGHHTIGNPNGVDTTYERIKG